MAWECSASTMQRMISLLKANSIIKDPGVESAMLKTDRAHYCPSESPYMDRPYPLGFGATISAPHMHAYALEVLKDKLQEGAKVLDVGSGSGYLTVCFAHMVGPTGTVYGVEHIGELLKKSEENIRRGNRDLLDSGRIKLFQADGRVGLQEYSPFDVIHVGASAPGLPEKLVEQLKEGGRMVIPVCRGQRQFFESVDKLPNGQIKQVQLFGVSYVPLTDAETQLADKRYDL